MKNQVLNKRKNQCARVFYQKSSTAEAPESVCTWEMVNTHRK